MAQAKSSFLDEPEVFRPADAAAASRAARRGELRRLARGLYSANLDEPVEQLVRRNWIGVTALYSSTGRRWTRLWSSSGRRTPSSRPTRLTNAG